MKVMSSTSSTKYPVGTIKLTWIDKNDYTILRSKMFSRDKIEDAIETGERLGKYMIFELEKTQNDEYKWKLMPYGQADDFVRSMKFRGNLLLKGLIVTTLVVGAFGIYKYIAKQK